MVPHIGSVSFLYHSSVMHCSAWMSLLLVYMCFHVCSNVVITFEWIGDYTVPWMNYTLTVSPFVIKLMMYILQYFMPSNQKFNNRDVCVVWCVFAWCDECVVCVCGVCVWCGVCMCMWWVYVCACVHVSVAHTHLMNTCNWSVSREAHAALTILDRERTSSAEKQAAGLQRSSYWYARATELTWEANLL